MKMRLIKMGQKLGVTWAIFDSLVRAFFFLDPELKANIGQEFYQKFFCCLVSKFKVSLLNEACAELGLDLESLSSKRAQKFRACSTSSQKTYIRFDSVFFNTISVGGVFFVFLMTFVDRSLLVQKEKKTVEN